MEWLNYHHLYYFHVVAREGTIAAACKVLRLAQPTISGQLKLLESSLGEPLFKRRGRRLELTEVGRTVHQYAGEIFGLGRELQDAVKGRSSTTAALRVGISDTVPKLIAHRLLDPALSATPAVRLVCTEDKTVRLLAELATRDLDLVISDSPLPAGSTTRAYNHLLGECGVTFFGTAKRTRALSGRFPASLQDAPMLLPTPQTELRRSIDRFFSKHEITPQTVAEFEDSALMKAFGEGGAGVFPGPTALADEICERYGVVPVGQTSEITERFYAITVERRMKHPAAIEIAENARARIFKRP